MKIQWKSMYVRCIDRMNLSKNLNSLNVQNCEHSWKNCVHQMYRQYEFVGKFEFVECVPNRENSMENCVHQMYKYSGLVEKFDFVESTTS